MIKELLLIIKTLSLSSTLKEVKKQKREEKISYETKRYFLFFLRLQSFRRSTSLGTYVQVYGSIRISPVVENNTYVVFPYIIGCYLLFIL